MLPLCLGIDCGARLGMGLVEPLLVPGPRGERAQLVRVVSAHGRGEDDWADRAFEAAEAIVRAAKGRRVVGFAERVPPAGKAWMGALRLAERRGQLLQALRDAGMSIAEVEYALVSAWTGPLGIPGKKLGDGSHRITEAERLIEMPADTLRGRGDSAIDAAESLLMATARAWRELGISAKVEKAPRKRKARAA